MQFRGVGFTWSLFLEEEHCLERNPALNGWMKTSGILYLALLLTFTFKRFSYILFASICFVCKFSCSIFFAWKLCKRYDIIDRWKSIYCILWGTKPTYILIICHRSIMSDIQRDNRVVSLSSRAGIRNSLVTLLDQLQRCQKSLNEFLEVHIRRFVQISNEFPSFVQIVENIFACYFAGEAFGFPEVLFHWWWRPFRNSGTGNQPNCHPVPSEKTLCRSAASAV